MRSTSIVILHFKLLYELLIIVGAVCLLSGCGNDAAYQQPNPQATWLRFSPSAGGFSVSMPGHPPEIITEQPRTNGTSIKVHNFVLNPDTPREFAIIYNDFPIDMPFIDEQILFDAGQGGALQKFGKGHLIYSKDSSFGNNPMREFKFRAEVAGKERVFEIRIILARRRLYQLVVVSQSGDDISKELVRFFNSFQLVDQK